MSLGLSSFTTFNNKTDLDQSPLKRNMLQKQPYLRQSSLGLDAEDERKITLEGWSQSNESFLFANGEDYKQDRPEVNQQNFQKNYSKVCKNALNNLSEGLTSMHKKKQVESLVDSLLKAPSDSKPKEPIDKQDKIEKTDFDFVTQVKTNQTAYSTSFDTLDARHKQEQKSKLSSDAKTNDLHSMQGDTKGFTTVDARGFSIDMDKINEAMNGSNNNNNNTEKLDKPDKSPKLFYRPPSKSHRTPRSEILTMKDQSRNASPMTTTKLTIHVINFKTKPLPSHASILDRFKIFSKHSPKPDNQLKIKSARTVSMNLDEKDSEAFQQSSQSPSPTARYIPLSENSPKKRNPIGKARFTNSTDVGMEMRIRGFGLQEPVSPPRKAISIAEQKATLKKIFGTKRELGNNDGKNGKGQQKPIYNILEAFKMQPVSRLHASKYEGSSKVKFARGQSMTNDISEEPKEIKAKEITVLQKTSRNAQSVSRQENSSPVGEDLEGVIQSIFDLRKTLHPIANFEPKNKKNVGKDFSTTFKNESNIIVPVHSKDYGYSSYSKMISAGSSKRLIVRNGGSRKDSEQGKANTHRDREL